MKTKTFAVLFGFLAATLSTTALAADHHLTEGQALQVAITANTGEVQLAESVLPRLEDPATRAFAQKMITEHSATAEMLNRIAAEQQITPEPSEIATALQTQTEETIQRLSSQTGKTLDVSYMDSQVVMHAAVLKLLKLELIPSAENPVLDRFLVEMSAHVKSHGREAKHILRKLRGSWYTGFELR